ncbi:MAG: aldose dehydrogenase [uncultured bacterium]|nr:MAG: aldose dehydrogenase [uncultured bacterium]
MILKDKIALVTGGSSGIGKAIAEALQDTGCQVIITYNTHKTNNPKFTEFPVDLREPNSIRTLFESISKQFSKLDILVNSAGVNTMGDPFDMNVWRDVFQVDLFSLVDITGHAVNLMKSGGKIINISSIYSYGKVAYKQLSAYSAAKAALNNYTETLAKNLAPKINVNAIAPGYVKTPMWGERTDEDFDRNGKEQLIERMIDPTEIASMALELARNDALTGEIIIIDGGLSLKTV